MKKTILGIGLLVLAGMILFQDYLPPLDIPIWSLLWIGGTGYLFIRYLFKGRWVETTILGTWFFILINNQLELLDLSTGSIVLAALLISAGLKILFQARTKTSLLKDGFIDKESIKEQIRSRIINQKEVTEGVSRIGASTGKSTVFGSSTRYVHNPAFVEDEVEIAFGTANIYLENAHMLGDQAVFYVEGVFATINLYVPHDWHIDIQMDNVFSTVKNYTGSGGQKTLTVSGDMAFGTLNIYSV